MKTIKTLKGYTTQAKYYESRMLNDEAGGSFVILGWMLVTEIDANADVRPSDLDFYPVPVSR